MINSAVLFIIDSTKTFLYFVLHPLQWMFFKIPKVYEILVTIIVFVKNNTPTKTELYHTWLHWSYLLLNFNYYVFINVNKLSIVICKQLHQKLKTNIEKLNIVSKYS